MMKPRRGGLEVDLDRFRNIIIAGVVAVVVVVTIIIIPMPRVILDLIMISQRFFLSC